jgi:hypothetical protein
MDELSEEGFGVWQDASHTTLVTSWRKFAEWADLLYKWVRPLRFPALALIAHFCRRPTAATSMTSAPYMKYTAAI